MKNYILLICFILVYLFSILAIGLKIRHIVNYPERYDHEDLEKRADELERKKSYFPFFKSLSHQYGMTGMVFTLLFTAIAFGIAYAINLLLCEGRAFLFVGTLIAGVCAAFFPCILLGFVIVPLTIKTPFFAVSVRDSFNVIGRRYIYRRAYKVFLVMFAAAMPFFYFSCNNYICYDHTAIYSSAYFEIGETVTQFDEIEGVKIYIYHNNSGSVDNFHYEILRSDGKWLNINRPNMGTKYFIEDVYIIDGYITELNPDCKREITPLNETDYKFIRERFSEEDAQKVYKLFGATSNQT